MKSIAVVILLIIQLGNISLNTIIVFLMKRLLFVVFYIGKYSPILYMCEKASQDWSHTELHSHTLFRYLGGQLLQ